MICYIDNLDLSFEDKQKLQSKHEELFNSLKEVEGFTIATSIEDKEVIIPNEQGIQYLLEENKKIGKVYGLTNLPVKVVKSFQVDNEVTDETDNSEDSNLNEIVENEDPIIETKKVVSVNVLNFGKLETNDSPKQILLKDTTFSPSQLSDKAKVLYSKLMTELLRKTDYSPTEEQSKQMLIDYLNQVDLDFISVLNGIGLYTLKGEENPNFNSLNGNLENAKQSLINDRNRIEEDNLKLGEVNITQLALFENEQELIDKLNTVEDLKLIKVYQENERNISTIGTKDSTNDSKQILLQDGLSDNVGKSNKRILPNTVGRQIRTNDINSFTLGLYSDTYTFEYEGQTAKTISLTEDADFSSYVTERFITSSISNPLNRRLTETYNRKTNTKLQLKIIKDSKNPNPIYYDFKDKIIIVNELSLNLIKRDYQVLKSNEFDAALDLILSEEIIHGITTEFLSKEDENTIYNEMPNSLKWEVTKVYGNQNLLFSPFHMVHEYIRQIIQQEINGSITESQRMPLLDMLREGLNKAIQFIKDSFNQTIFTKQKVNEIIDNINNKELVQITDSLTIPQSNEEIINKLKETLALKYTEFSLEILDKLGVNGLVDFGNKVIQIQKGKEIALSEEMAHVILALHPNKKMFLDLVSETKLFGLVFNEYKNRKEYWKDGKINSNLIREEAAGKLLAEAIYATNTGDWSKFSEWIVPNRQKDFISRLKQAVLNFFGFIKSTNFSIFKEAANQILNNEIDRVEKFSNEYTLLQISNSLQDNTLESIRQIFNQNTSFGENKGDELLSKIKGALSIVHSNMSLAIEDMYKGNIILPINTIKHAEALLEKIDVREQNLVEVASSLLLTLESIGRFAKFSSNLSNLNPQQVIKLQRFVSQWSFYIDDLRKRTKIKGEFDLFLRNIEGELSNLERKVFDEFHETTLEILKKYLNPATEGIIQRAKERLIKRNNLWSDEFWNDNLVKYFQKYTNEDWNKSVLNPITDFDKKIAAIGKLSKVDINDIKSIVENTYDDKKLSDIINGKGEDTNLVARLFYGASTSKDAIIAAYQKMIETAKLKGAEIAKFIVENYMNKLKPLIRKTDLNRFDIGKAITIVTKRIVFDKIEDTYAYLTDVKQEAFVEQEKRKKELDSLGKGSDEWKKQNIIYQEWLSNNFYREYTDEYYDNQNDTSEIGIRVKELTKSIWSTISKTQDEIESLPYIVNGAYNPERITLENDLDKLYIEYKKLYSEFENGNKKDQKGIEVAQYLNEKVKNQKMWSYEEREGSLDYEFAKFLGYLEQVSPLEFNSVALTQIKKLIKDRATNPQALKEADTLVQQLKAINENSETAKWWRKNIKRIYTQDFYDSRGENIKKIQDLVKQLNDLKGVSMDNTKTWESIFGIVKPFKDIDGIINGEQLSSVELEQIRDFEQLIEDAKFSAKASTKVVDKATFKILSKELTQTIKELTLIQERVTTGYYNEKLNDFGITDVDGSEFLKGLRNMELFGENSIEEFANDNLENPKEFLKWFEANHVKRINIDMYGEETIEWLASYAWVEIKPLDQKHINYTVTSKYQRKVVAEQYKQNPIYKDEFGRWKPKLENRQGEKTGWENTEYTKLKNSANPQDKALYEILKELKKQHIEAQELNNRAMYFYIPQKTKESLEDPQGFVKNIKTRFESQVQEEGGGNFQDDNLDDTIGENKGMVAAFLNPKGKVGKFFGKLTGLGNESNVSISKDYQGERIVKTALLLYNHIPIENLSRDILLSQAMFIESSKVHQAFNEINPNTVAIYKTLKKNRTGEQRLATIENIEDREIQGINKLYEVGVGVDKFISFLKKIGNLRSQSLFNIKNAIKNHLAGTGNIYINKSLLGKQSLAKAERDFMNKYMEIKSQMLLDKPKTKDFKIFEYFIPRIGGNYKFYMSNKLSQTFRDGSFFYSLQEEGEFQLFGVTLELYLSNKYKDGTIRDYLKVKENEFGVQAPYLDINGDGVETEQAKEDLANLKLRCNELMRIVQGNQGNQKAKTESSRYTVLSAIMFYRNYLPYSLINRFSQKRTNFYSGEEMEGYYRTTFRILKDMVQDINNIQESWGELTELEKDNVIKTLKELSIIIGITILLWLLGYSDWDKDRFKKLKNNNYFENLLIYELITSYNEVIGLSPLRGTSFFSEAAGNITKTSMAFGEIGKLVNVINDVFHVALDLDSAYVQKKTATAKKGDLKVIEDLQKLIGWNNLITTGDNKGLQEQIKNYVLQIERN